MDDDLRRAERARDTDPERYREAVRRAGTPDQWQRLAAVLWARCHAHLAQLPDGACVCGRGDIVSELAPVASRLTISCHQSNHPLPITRHLLGTMPHVIALWFDDATSYRLIRLLTLAHGHGETQWDVEVDDCVRLIGLPVAHG